MSAKKVAIVSESMPHFYNSGVGVVIEECLAAIANNGWESLLIGPAFPGCKDHAGVWIPSAKIARGYRTTAATGFLYFQSLKKHLADIDIVHIHSISSLTFLMLDIISTMERRPKVILHLHTQADEYLRKWGMGVWSALMNDVVGRYCAEKTDMVIVPTDFFREIAETSYGLTDSRVWTAPISLPDKMKTTASKAELIESLGLGLSPEASLLYYIGRVGPEKNLDFLFEVMKALQGEDVGLIVTGGGMIDRYRSKLPPDIRRKVGFLGQQPREVGIGLCSNMSMGLTASTTETQGVALLEQMAMSLPVIAPMFTCFDQPITESGGGEILDLDPALWAKAIRCYMHQPTLSRDSGRCGAQYVRAKYSRETQHGKLIAIYEEVLGG
jgi:1,2-diacylglycerol 3-alpha-glucosyltransferase